MKLIVSGDATYVSGWQEIYGAACPITKVPVDRTEARGEPTKKFLDAFFPALDKLITTPLAFAILAPKGWNGERCWFKYDTLPEYGWEPVAWKESTHKDKTLVQLYRRSLPGREFKEAPKAPSEKFHHGYVGKLPNAGTLPYLGCSSILTSYDEPRAKFDKVLEVGMYGGMASKDCLHLIRLARPASLHTLNLLKNEGFWNIGLLKHNTYWVRGRKGFGELKDCKY